MVSADAPVEIVVLGSGSPVPDPGRAGSSLAIVSGDDWLMVDCGRAATQRAIDAGLDLRRIVAVAMTHHHSDHISDLATLATTRWAAGAPAPLPVVVPRGPLARHATRCLEVFDDGSFYGQSSNGSVRPAIVVHTFDAPTTLARVHGVGAWNVSSILVDHHPIEPAVGYLVEHLGSRVAVSGDTAVCDAIHQLARDVDALVHQAVLADHVAPDLLDWNADARSVGHLAALARPRHLVLTHLIPAPTSPRQEMRYVEAVRAAGFKGPTTVAYDLLRIAVPMGPKPESAR